MAILRPNVQEIGHHQGNVQAVRLLLELEHQVVAVDVGNTRVVLYLAARRRFPSELFGHHQRVLLISG